MIEWILSLNNAEKWFYGLIFTAITALFIQWFSQRLNHALAAKRERRKRIVAAASVFRSAINIEILEGLRGHQLHNALLGVVAGNGTKFEGEFFKHKRAVAEYQVHLGLFDRFFLQRAWHKYHGGNENIPDIFKNYCIKDNGPELLRQRLAKLKNIGNKC